MSWIESPQLRVAEKVVASLKKRDDLMGVVIFGTLGEENRVPRPDSDVDLIAIIDSDKWSSKFFKVDGIPVELFIMNVLRVINALYQGSSEMIVRNIGAGRVYYYKDPLTLMLKEFAEKLYKKGPPPRAEVFILFARIMYKNALNEVIHRCKDLGEKLYLQNLIFYRAILNYYQFQCAWLPKWTYLFEDLKKRDSFLYGLCKSFLLESDIDRKYDCLKKLVKHILKPVGGYAPKEWRIDWLGPKITVINE